MKILVTSTDTDYLSSMHGILAFRSDSISRICFKNYSSGEDKGYYIDEVNSNATIYFNMQSDIIVINYYLSKELKGINKVIRIEDITSIEYRGDY